MKSCPTCNRTYPDDTLAFCLVDGAVLSAPYDPEQTRRIPPQRPTAPAVIQLISDQWGPPQQSTIHAPAPAAPSRHPQSASVETVESRQRSLAPWLLIAGAILIVGIFGVWMIVSRLPLTLSSRRSQASPEPTSTVAPKVATICGQTVSPAIFRKWTDVGGETGKLGCPINQETDAPASPQGSVGRWIQFAKGDGGYLILWSRPSNEEATSKPVPPAGQAFEVSGCMFKLYASLGGTKSWLGFPVSDGRETPTGARQDFEAGYIVWASKTYVCEAHRNE